MAEFPYTPSPASLKRLFEHIQSAKAPEKVTIKYLKSAGFTSSNDQYLSPILKFIGFLDGTGIPGDSWRAYRAPAKAKRVLAEAIRRGYKPLFDMYADAFRKDKEALRNFFSTHTNVGEATLNLIVRTFETLCELADFEGPATKSEIATSTETIKKKGTLLDVEPRREGKGMAVNINIQLQLPATDDSKVYDRLFEAMKKHLLM